MRGCLLAAENMIPKPRTRLGGRHGIQAVSLPTALEPLHLACRGVDLVAGEESVGFFADDRAHEIVRFSQKIDKPARQLSACFCLNEARPLSFYGPNSCTGSRCVAAEALDFVNVFASVIYLTAVAAARHDLLQRHGAAAAPGVGLACPPRKPYASP